MAAVKPFKIEIDPDRIKTLLDKLAVAEFPDELQDSGWDYGCPLKSIKRLANAWKAFDFSKWTERLNGLPQYTTDIEVDGFACLNIHFVHGQSARHNAIPLLFVHGWPGCFAEVGKILAPLTDDSSNGPSFHVVAPSLPKFGFSEGVRKRGFGLRQYSEVCHKLMKRLGYDQYVTQAGDWGYWITRAIGKQYPQACKASHLNMLYVRDPTPEIRAEELSPALRDAVSRYTAAEEAWFKRAEWFKKEGKAYDSLQSSKPQTLAYSLADSPVGLLAWLWEKLHDWADDYPWTDEELLGWLSIYYFSRAGPGAPQRIYFEVTHDDSAWSHNGVIGWIDGVKLGITFNPKEIHPFPISWANQLGEVVYVAVNGHGGHFYAHEHPEWLVRDVKAMFGKGGPAYSVVKSKGGY